jgi:aminopeptidase-like protein
MITDKCRLSSGEIVTVSTLDECDKPWISRLAVKNKSRFVIRSENNISTVYLDKREVKIETVKLGVVKSDGLSVNEIIDRVIT